jgi:hypothetical protein
MDYNDLANSLAHRGSEPSPEPKVDRLAQYSAHRLVWWGSTVDLLAWRAETITDMTDAQRTQHLLRQFGGVIGSLEQC